MGDKKAKKATRAIAAKRQWGVGSGNKEISFPSPFPIPHSPLPFCFFLFAFWRLTLDVSASQGYRIECQIGNDRSGRRDYLQAEPISSSRLAAVDDRCAERMV